MPELKKFTLEKTERLFRMIYNSQKNQIEFLNKDSQDELKEEVIFENHLRNLLDRVAIPEME